MRTVRSCLERVVWLLLGGYFLAVLLALLSALLRLLRACLIRRPRPERPLDSITIPEHAYRQPDPLIYSQFWLQQRGLAVTWQNPDIHLELGSAPGSPVNSFALAPDTEYRIFARIWNGSATAPAAGVRVEFSYLDFGIGGQPAPIGYSDVDLAVKGAAGLPAIASIAWRTPPTPGHYCLQVRIIWPFDADPDNNLGQHNVDVQPLNSPTARFTVPLQNPDRYPVTIRLATDAYALPRRRPCPPRPVDPAEHERQTRTDHDPRRYPMPEGWRVDLGELGEEASILLAPGESRAVPVTVTAPDGFSGRQVVNVHGYDGARLIGGVTLFAEGNVDG